MASIGFPDTEPWVVAGWAFRQLLTQARSETDNEEDRQALEAAEAIGGLSFELLDSPQQGRLASALAKAAATLRMNLDQLDSSDPRDAEFSQYLRVLESNLEQLLD